MAVFTKITFQICSTSFVVFVFYVILKLNILVDYLISVRDKQNICQLITVALFTVENCCSNSNNRSRMVGL